MPPPSAEHFAVNPAVLADASRGWRALLRIDTVGGNVDDVVQASRESLPERLVYAEGDSWFDKFTPLGTPGTNLLDAIRIPYRTAVVDVSHIGDEVRDMVRGQQARQTAAMFKLFGFHAILLSAGGNDLKNVFAELFASKAPRDAGVMPRSDSTPDVDRWDDPASYRGFFDVVMRNIGRFVALRDTAGDPLTRAAPIFVHGYDYLQPRPAKAAVFAGSAVGSGPWLYPALRTAGLSAAQMRAAADAVVDELNRHLLRAIGALPNVHVIDQRGLLTPAAAGSTGADADWLDEIHPTQAGFVKLARNRWDVPLAAALGWPFADDERVPALAPSNRSTAQADQTDRGVA